MNQQNRENTLHGKTNKQYIPGELCSFRDVLVRLPFVAITDKSEQFSDLVEQQSQY